MKGLNAINNSNVSVITLNSDISTPQPKGDSPLIPANINQELTTKIRKGKTLIINNAGIILGSNLQLVNIPLSFPNPVCNAIIADGHKLILDGAKMLILLNITPYIFSVGV